MNRVLPVGSTSTMVIVKLRDSTTGQLKTGVAYGSVTYSYWIDGASSGGTGTCVDATLGAFTSTGWKETSYAGMYQFGIPNAALASGSGVSIKLVASGAIDAVVDVQLTSATRGLTGTAVPDAVAGAASGLSIVGSQMDLKDAPNATAVTAIQLGLSKPGTAQTITWGSTAPANWIDAAAIAADVSAEILGANAPTGWVNAAAIAAAALNGKGDWVTTLGTNAPAGWLNAAAFAASSLDGKGDWAPDTLTDASITSAIDTSLSGTHGGGPWGGGGVAGVGTGIIYWPVTCQVDGVVESDVEVWITTYEAGTNVVAGPVASDNFGVVPFYLNAGDYFVFREKSGINFSNPQTITVA